MPRFSHQTKKPAAGGVPQDQIRRPRRAGRPLSGPGCRALGVDGVGRGGAGGQAPVEQALQLLGVLKRSGHLGVSGPMGPAWARGSDGPGAPSRGSR